ncbi:Eukaryotic translation initiation factor 4 gamma 3, partial [Armadillidium nasatum]
MALSSKGNDNTTTPIQSRDFSTANTPALGDAVQRSGPNNHLATEFARSVINRMAMGDETDEQPEPIVNPKKQLKTAEDAWKPSVRKELNEDEIIIRKMREILDTLTPVNFEKLAVQIMKFKIVEFGTFDSVIGLIFEKAIGEQVFSKTYADLCKGLSHFSFKVKTEKEEEGGELRFKNILINKCKEEFEKDNSEDLQKEER